MSGVSEDENLLSEGDDEVKLGSFNNSKYMLDNLLDNDDSSNKSPTKKQTPAKKLNWNIDDLKTAILNLNETEEIRTIRKLFREERRQQFGVE